MNMKKHFIIMLTLSSVVLLSSALPVNVSAEEDSLPTTVEELQDWLLEHGKIIEKPDYALPYTLDEFLALTDDEFLALPDVPEEVKADYKRIRMYAPSSAGSSIYFRFHDDIKLSFEMNSQEAEKEICNILGIPYNIIYEISQDENKDLPFSLRFNGETYQDYSLNELQNKISIYIKYHNTVANAEADYLCTTDIQKGDATGDGEVNILDIISLNKAVMGKETLTEAQLQAVDFNQNGKPDADEALTLLKYIVGLISEL